LKNKNKSAKVQQYVEQVKKQVADGGSRDAKKAEALAEQKKKEKEEKLQREKEMQELFKQAVNVQQAVVPAGVDPKSIVCEFFKKGLCTKGAKCKFSHDLAQQRRGEKIDLYTDIREKDDMATWDQKKLEDVIGQKQDADNLNLPTDIVCKYFITAVEKRQYGWFWQCPNDVDGGKCKYKHALPPGFVLKQVTTENDDEEEEDPPTLEEQIEEERTRLHTFTPITFESFMKWKEDQKKLKENEAWEAEQKRKADIKAGKVQMSGLELFEFNPDAFIDDDAADNERYVAAEDLHDEDVKHGNKPVYGNDDDDDDDDGDDGDDGNNNDNDNNGNRDGDDDDDDDDDAKRKDNVKVEGVAVNQDLFGDDDDDDDD
jgi:hypothetical protein